MINSKKGFSIIVGISLLLITSITAYLIFEIWYSNYSQELTFETSSKLEFNPIIRGLKNNSLYIKTNTNQNFDLFEIYENSNLKCSFSNSELAPLIILNNPNQKILNTSTCNLEQNKLYEVLIIQNKKSIKQKITS